MPIPGLEHIPIDDSSDESSGITLFSFDLTPFTIPDSHITGKCRQISDFNKVSRIGEGAFGSVYKVIDKKNGETIALKKLKIEKDAMQMMPLCFLREITVLKKLKHANVVDFKGIAVGKNFESTYLILEYCQYSLSKVLEDEDIMLDPAQIKCIMAQLFTGLEYVHDKNIIHRDLSVSNILFTASAILKISDFGSSRVRSSCEMTPNVVSRWYRAPEVLFGSRSYTSAIDMWAAGCIFAELLQRKPLFAVESDNDLIKLIIDTLGTPTETLWPGFSELPLLKSYNLYFQPYNRLRQIFAKQPGTCVSLLHKLFLFNPATRFTAKASLQHTYYMDEPHACYPVALIPALKASEKI